MVIPRILFYHTWFQACPTRGHQHVQAAKEALAEAQLMTSCVDTDNNIEIYINITAHFSVEVDSAGPKDNLITLNKYGYFTQLLPNITKYYTYITTIPTIQMYNTYGKKIK